ncbi:electron transfer flavoprotein alpha-subunit [Thermoplasma volcanium GSS1]|uniref:Electron transfer flavoprotein alpha-subunit n=1 Tax=Thermoplasma volcanium (strain ATCC 51530 / DSM 4299 / JCM 9571 / NBRC 15438 / GSS1) TaxID=273116 RepID=Q978K7_THEVO|nr:electron transfer flavoprotein subunit alpha/FixB family protein [Thermoplasma volcanium]BAB60550.1 electron transfer flavoprotein alpha-subunit [Thermoplasma volcanium GSS1]
MKALVVSDDINFLKQACTLVNGKAEYDAVYVGEGRVSGVGASTLYTVKKGTPYDAVADGILEIMGNYDIIVAGSTEFGREVAGYIAGKTGYYAATEIFSLEFSNGKAKTKRFFYGGKTVIEEESDAKVFTVAPGVIEAKEFESKPEEKDLPIKPSKVRVNKVVPKNAGGVRLEDAKIIVSVGRGIGSKENISKIEPLVNAVKGELAGSRPVCMDYGWLSEDRQVGLSGKKVSPKLYIALGISGQIQHIAGMRNSKTVIAINKDKNAPIFQECDYGIVGDIFAIVPKIVEELKK